MSTTRSNHFQGPRPTGSRPQTTQDLNFLPPSLVAFLNNYLERIPLARLGGGHRRCVVCLGRMCDEQHDQGPVVTMAVLAARPPAAGQPQHPGLNPSGQPDVPGHPFPPNPPAQPHPAGQQDPPGQPNPPPQAFHTHPTCPNPGRCEIAVRVSRFDCGHIFGSHCVVEWIKKPRTKCPICHSAWFRGEANRGMVMSVLRESWPTQMKRAAGKGRIDQWV
jgi:hypothetical protein